MKWIGKSGNDNYYREKEILSEWYQQFYKIMRKKAYDMVEDYDVANDLVNAAFEKIIKNFSTVHELNDAERAVYFMTTIKSVSLNCRRKRNIESRYVEYSLDDARNSIEQIVDERPTPDQIYEKKEEFQEIVKYLECLPEEQRSLLVDKYYWNMSDKEISKQRNMKEEHVHTYVRRAKQKIRRMLGKGGLEDAQN